MAAPRNGRLNAFVAARSTWSSIPDRSSENALSVPAGGVTWSNAGLHLRQLPVGFGDLPGDRLRQ